MPVLFRAKGKRRIRGIIHFGFEVLTIEIEKNRWFGSNQINTFEIPLDEIDYVDFRRGLVGAQMTVRTLYFETAKKLPWRNGIEVGFKFTRRERDGAEEIAMSIEDAIRQQQEDVT